MVSITRQTNLRKIAAGFDNNTQLAKLLGLSKSGISQIIGRNAGRAISEKQARRFERALGLAEGALDRDFPEHPEPSPALRGWEVTMHKEVTVWLDAPTAQAAIEAALKGYPDPEHWEVTQCKQTGR